MFDIIADVGLEQYFLFVTGHAATIDEVSHNMTHFGYMGMGGDIIAIGQDKPKKSSGMLSEDVLQIVQFQIPQYTY